ncbi:MAG: DNA-binding protein WhiA [Lachnospiraceae bacterium]|nr:DNA-binding protein WhiA [Lachnospiraceae bacterium]
MSFSGDVKNELARLLPDEYHCLLAEIAAILRFAGTVEGGPQQGIILVETENVVLAKKYLRLIKKAFDISVDLTIHKGASGKTNVYRILLTSEENGGEPTGESFERVWRETANWEDPEFAKSLLEYSCCRRAFIRGAFLASGSMSDPGKSYHFEIICHTRKDADELARLIETFGIEPKQIERKHKFLVYLKDSGDIVDILNVMGASRALMHLENVRIIKEMKNSANRQFNCDSANINKTVRAAARQLEDIRLIQTEMGLDKLTPQLREMAEVRLEHPEESLQELGDYLDPPVGKSGVNHRLTRLGEIAQSLRQAEA